MVYPCDIIVLRSLFELNGVLFCPDLYKAGPDLVIFFDMEMALYDIWEHWKPISDLKAKKFGTK